MPFVWILASLNAKPFVNGLDSARYYHCYIYQIHIIFYIAEVLITTLILPTVESPANTRADTAKKLTVRRTDMLIIIAKQVMLRHRVSVHTMPASALKILNIFYLSPNSTTLSAPITAIVSGRHSLTVVLP